MTGRELAREIQSQNKGFRKKYEYTGSDYVHEIYGKQFNNVQEFDAYCESMSGEVEVYNINDLK